MMRMSRVVPILVLVAAIWPVATFTDYHLFQLTMVVVYAIAILGLALLTGFNGQISLGHGAFYAIGAYTTAILMTTWEVPYWATLPVSAVLCAGFGFLLGFLQDSSSLGCFPLICLVLSPLQQKETNHRPAQHQAGVLQVLY